MLIYQSGMSIDVLETFCDKFPGRRLNVLLSFGRPDSEKSLLAQRRGTQIASLILDSGTYTTNNSRSHNGLNIVVESYIQYLKTVSSSYDFYFNFDSGHGTDSFGENWQNQKRIEQVGLTPIPVIHNTENYEVQHYIDRKDKYDYVAIGSVQANSYETLERPVKTLYDAGIKVHIFGHTTYKIIARLPVYSCDSASWTRRAGHGDLLYWNDLKEQEDKSTTISLVSKTNRRMTSSRLPDDFLEYMDSVFGYSYININGLHRQRYREIMNLYFFTELERIATEKQRELSFTF